MKAVSIALCLAVAGALVACGQEAKDTHPDQLVTKRRTLFKQLNRAMEPIGLMASGRQAFKQQEFLALVQDLESTSSKPWAYFTADSNYPPTRAVAAVWERPDAFKKAQDQYLATVQQLARAAQAGDAKAVEQATNHVNSSCKACHREFRAD